MRKIELKLDKSKKDSKNGVYAMSIVKNAAMETTFLKLSEEVKEEVKKFVFSNETKEEQIITGIAMIPDKMIYRSDVGGDEGYVYFSKETVKDLAHMFLSENRNNNATLEHEEATDDLTLLESWVVESTEFDKSVHLGLSAPLGSWVVSYKVNNDELWQDIKLGKYTGFSIESRMIATIVDQFSKEEKQILTEEEKEELVEKLVQDFLKKSSKSAE